MQCNTRLAWATAAILAATVFSGAATAQAGNVSGQLVISGGGGHAYNAAGPVLEVQLGSSRKHHSRRYHRRFCAAVARRRNGHGRRIRSTYSEGYGRRACRKAMRRCIRALDYRQARGRNPFARCVFHGRRFR